METLQASLSMCNSKIHPSTNSFFGFYVTLWRKQAKILHNYGDESAKIGLEHPDCIR